jgi:phosphoglycolate phosphatase
MRAVLFDLDGTLADTRAGIVSALTSAIDGIGPSGGIFLGRIRIGPPLLDTIRLAAPDASPQQVESIARAFSSVYDAGACCECRAYPGIQPLVESICGLGLICGVVTNKREAPARTILVHLHLMPRLALVIGPDSRSPRFSSKCEALLSACTRLGLNPDEVLYVGDTDQDRLASTAAGMSFIGAGWGGYDDPVTGPAVARTPEDVLTAIRSASP